MKPSVGVIAAVSPRGEKGGAERFYAGLCDALLVAGLAVELIELRSDERKFECVEESYLQFYGLDLRRFDGIVTSKAPAYVARHSNHVCYLQHTMRAFYDMFESSFPAPSNRFLDQRRLIQALDTAALRPPRTRRLFAIGEEVAERLRRYNGLDAQVLRHPTSLCGLREGAFRYLLLPGRLHRWKRVDLAIEAMRFVKAPIELVISGVGEDEVRLRHLARGEPRIRFAGYVSDDELTNLYSDALAVLFTPRNEDLGLVTLEAFLSGKPVITCTDSGEPSRLVRNGETGFVCSPEPGPIALCIEELFRNPDRAAAMGRRGGTSVASITWDHVAGQLAAALGFGGAVGAGAAAG